MDRLLRKYEGTGLSPRDCMRAARSEFVIRAEPGIEKSVENEHLAAGDAIDQEIERLMAADEEQDQEWERLMAAAEEAEQIPEEVNIEPTEPRGRLRSTPTPPPPPKYRRPRLFSEEWQRRRDVEARNRETRKEAERKKGGMSEGMTVVVGLFVAFLLISGLGDCEGGGDCVDSYGQVRIDNC